MSSNQRNYAFDNLKGLLVFLVVFGHLIQFTRGKAEPIVGYTYTGIYLFHMPLFVFISGYFSKKENPKRLIELFLVYALWQVGITPLFLSITTDVSYIETVESVLNPTNHHWYLFSLITWRILTPYLAKLKHMIPLSFILGTLIGLSPLLAQLSPATKDASLFSFGRTIGFFPFFLMGYFFQPKQFEQLRQKINPWVGVGCFLTLVVFGVYFLNSQTELFIKPQMINKILFMREAFINFLNHPLQGIGLRAVCYLLQLGFVFSALSFVNQRKTILSTIGQHSFFIYISHGMLILTLNKLYFSQQSSFDAISVLIGAFITTTLYCLLLCTRPFKTLGRLLTHFPLNLLYREDVGNKENLKHIT